MVGNNTLDIQDFIFPYAKSFHILFKKFVPLPFKKRAKVMYCILVYDVGEKRVVKMLKLCRQYLNWIQNSVFEGELTEFKLKELTFKMKEIMDEAYDSVIIFSSRNERWLDKQIIGVDKNPIDNFL